MERLLHYLPMIIFFSLPALIAARYHAYVLVVIYVIMALLVYASIYNEED